VVPAHLQKGLERMKKRLATILVVVATLVVGTFFASTTTTPAAKADGVTWPIDVFGTPRESDDAILKWDEQLLNTIRAYPAQTGPTITARALGVLHTATYDAWAAYDPIAKVTRPDGPAQQQSGNTLANKTEAISYAAYRVLNDLFPPSNFPCVPADCPTDGSAKYLTPDKLLIKQGYDPANTTPASPTNKAATPSGIGNLAGKAVLDFRHNDGSNQLNGYADTTGYTPKNTWNHITPPDGQWHWQPLCVLTAAGVNAGKPPIRDPNQPCPDADGYYSVQKPLTPQWGKVIPFSLAASSYRVPGPAKNPDGSYSTADIDLQLQETSNLTDAQKATAEYWADGPHSEFPPGHTALFAQAFCRKNNFSLDTDVKMFFAVGNAMMDASIAAWYQKYIWDFVRPITGIRERYRDQYITSWKGPNQGYGQVLGQNWLPYQALNVVTPPFPEYVSGHSTFTAAGATLLAAFTGSDTFGATVTIPAHSSKFESNTPATDVTLSFPTFSDASNQAGMSRRYGGIHFQSGDYHGRALGRQVAQFVWGTAQNYIKGYLGKQGS
jgi:hypothetical protein